MIEEITLLNFDCAVCKEISGIKTRADFLVKRDNSDLDPTRYITAGSRQRAYCKKHMPADAAKMWKELAEPL